MCSSDLYRRGKRFLAMIKEAVLGIGNLFSFSGLLAVLYVSFIIPIFGVATGISPTGNFRIPDFIMSFIRQHFWMKTGYRMILFLLVVLGCLFGLTFIIMVTDNIKARAAMSMSCKFVAGQWRNILKGLIPPLLKILMAAVLCIGIPAVTAFFFIEEYVTGKTEKRFGYILCIFLILAAITFIRAILGVVVTMKLTMLYKSLGGKKQQPLPPVRRFGKKIPAIIFCAALIIAVSASAMGAMEFDYFFPLKSRTHIIGHRGAGFASSENTVESIVTAEKKGLFASEIDVQRTKDGKYIINHDDDFKRTCGVDQTPGEMTFDQIARLRVKNVLNTKAPGQHVATIEEMLDAAKGKLNLYVELKGKTADRKMADDLYELVKRREALRHTTFICLKYDLIEYLEKKHPDAETGYICFYSFGDLEKMSCDSLLLEMETATQVNVDRIHRANKKVVVWTVNAVGSINSFLLSAVDAMITDEVENAISIKKFLYSRGDLLRILDAIWIET